MLFNSIEFLFIFLPIVFTIYFLLNKFNLYKTSRFFLLTASLFFYGTYKWEYVPIIIVSILFNYFISFIFKKDVSLLIKRNMLILGLFGNIFILLFFKYFNYLFETFKNISLSPINAIEIIIPLGISFFTLQQISYLIDCYKGDVEDYNLLDYALFVCFFPQLVAGPIVRHQEMIPQFRNIKNSIINQDNIFIGIFLITIGLLKKTIFADGFVDFISYINEAQITHFINLSWTLGITKVFQGYFDFSGYCDMALGSAFLFNISLPWNFNSPFKAESIIDFWHRWNMSLLRFLRTYVYKPFGGDKKGELRTNLNILSVFLIMGIWISTTPVSVLYGLLNGIFVCVNRLWNKFHIKINKFLSMFLTFMFVVISTQFIFAEKLNVVMQHIQSMLYINSNYLPMYVKNFNLIFDLRPPHNAQFNILLLIFSFIILFFGQNSTQLARLYVRVNNTFYTFILAVVFILSVLSITRSTEFIYFNF